MVAKVKGGFRTYRPEVTVRELALQSGQCRFERLGAS